MSVPHPWLNRIHAVFGSPASRFARAEKLASDNKHTSAFPLFVQAANAGLPRAQYRLGCCYLTGLGVPLCLGEALRWLRRASEADEPAAQTRLAYLALQGVTDHQAIGLFAGVSQPADFERAEYWSRKAIASGSAEAKGLLAFILTTGPEERRDLAAAEILYHEAAEAGWPAGRFGAAMNLLRNGTPESATQAIELLQAAAGDGVANAHHVLGMLAESGLVGPVDLTAAAARYRHAAESGLAVAQVRYGFAMLQGRGVEQDVFNAETWLRRAAMAGDGQAAAVIGYLYARDGDLPANYAEASMWLRRAAEAGHVAAAHTLGRLLMQGIGIPKDFAEAVKWLQFAAEKGDEAARAELIGLAITQVAGQEERSKLARWLREDAAAGDPRAQYDLGLCLAHGIEGEPDNIGAYTWVRRAADGGYSKAALLLAALDEASQVAAV